MDESPKTHEPYQYSRLPKMREGDIVVTRVAHHYAVGRINADQQTQTHVEAQDHRSDALSRACGLAGADHCVFLHELAGPGLYIQINCSDNFDPKGVHGERRIKSRAVDADL
jgi:hypothetical protein